MRMKIKIAEKGGAGSGNWGHAGRPGMVGGSAPTIAPAIGAQMTILKGRTATQRQAEARRGKPTGSAFSDNAPGNEAAEGMLSSSNLTVNKDVKYSPGINVSRVVDIEGDGKAIIKPVSSTDVQDAYSEVIAYEVAKVLGWDDLVPPTVMRPVGDLSGEVSGATHVLGMSRRYRFEPTDVMSVQLWTDGAETAHDYNDRVGVWSNTPTGWNVDARALGRMALLDGVLANMDRHQGNFLIKGTQPIAVDHGISMGDHRRGSMYTDSTLDTMRVVSAPVTIHPDDVNALSKLYNVSDAFKTTANEAGYGAGYKYMMSRVNELTIVYGQKELDRVTIPIKVGPKPVQ